MIFILSTSCSEKIEKIRSLNSFLFSMCVRKFIAENSPSLGRYRKPALADRAGALAGREWGAFGPSVRVWGWGREAGPSKHLRKASHGQGSRLCQGKADEVSLCGGEYSVALGLALGFWDLPEAKQHQAHVDGIRSDADDAEIIEHEKQDPGQVDGTGNRHQRAQYQQDGGPASPQATCGGGKGSGRTFCLWPSEDATGGTTQTTGDAGRGVSKSRGKGLVLWHVMLACSTGTSLNPGCSTSDTVPCGCIWESSGIWPMWETWKEAPSLWLWASPALAVGK